MQTFLPYEDFNQSTAVLDRQRLGKQRVEALQLLKAIGAMLPENWVIMTKSLFLYGCVRLYDNTPGCKDNVGSLEFKSLPHLDNFLCGFYREELSGAR